MGNREDNSNRKVVVLGINGRLGQEIAKAFLQAGFRVSGMGRENRISGMGRENRISGMGRKNATQLDGIQFIQGDADRIEDLKAAIAGQDIVVNALNLPYHQWNKGRAEAMLARVIEAMGDNGKVLMFPGNIYNYSAQQQVLTPDLPFEPETEKGDIRVRMEAQLQAAAQAGHIKLVIIRSGDFYGPDASQSFLEVVITARKKDRTLQIPHDMDMRHSWAYLPDLARVYVALARRTDSFRNSETFHFRGHFLSGHELTKLIQTALGEPWKVGKLPWGIMKVIGWVNPLLREVVKMRYLFKTPHQLKDERLEAILTEDFGTGFRTSCDTSAADAIAETVWSYLPEHQPSWLTEAKSG